MSTTTTVNVDLLRSVLEYVTAHPEKHDQRSWARRTDCGTAACLAGHLVLMVGLKIDWPTWHPDANACFLTDGRDIGDAAAEILGIELYDPDEHYDSAGVDQDGDDLEHRHLFSVRNTLAELWMIAERITDGAIEVPAQFRGGAA